MSLTAFISAALPVLGGLFGFINTKLNESIQQKGSEEHYERLKKYDTILKKGGADFGNNVHEFLLDLSRQGGISAGDVVSSGSDSRSPVASEVRILIPIRYLTVLVTLASLKIKLDRELNHLLRR